MKKVKNYWLVKKRQSFAWRKFLKEFRINERMAGDFFGVERRTIAEWRRRESIPVEHLDRLAEMNETEAEKLRRWADYDLAALQEKLGCTKVALGKKLRTSSVNISNWQKQGRIPKTYLDAVLALRKSAPKKKGLKKPKRAPSLAAYMKRRGLNPRMVGDLLKMTNSPIREWKLTGKIPARHMQKLLSLTKEETDAKKRWIKYDLVALRDELGVISRTELGELLGTKERTLSFWEKDGRVLRSLLPRIRKLEAEARE